MAIASTKARSGRGPDRSRVMLTVSRMDIKLLNLTPGSAVTLNNNNMLNFVHVTTPKLE